MCRRVDYRLQYLRTAAVPRRLTSQILLYAEEGAQSSGREKLGAPAVEIFGRRINGPQARPSKNFKVSQKKQKNCNKTNSSPVKRVTSQLLPVRREWPTSPPGHKPKHTKQH